MAGMRRAQTHDCSKRARGHSCFASTFEENPRMPRLQPLASFPERLSLASLSSLRGRQAATRASGLLKIGTTLRIGPCSEPTCG
jgi:hypothetical protein